MPLNLSPGLKSSEGLNVTGLSAASIVAILSGLDGDQIKTIQAIAPYLVPIVVAFLICRTGLKVFEMFKKPKSEGGP